MTMTFSQSFRHRGFAAACSALAVLGAIPLAHAQGAYPTERVIRIVTPYDPGSLVDVTTRLVAEGLKAELGQNVVVENRTGGMGMIAMTAFLNAPADGYTLISDTPASAINPTLYKAKYNPKTDIAPIAQFMRLPFAIGVHPSVPVRTASELVAHARKNPNAIDMAVAGTSTRLAGELFSIQNGVKFNPIPYKGAAPAMLSVLKNETQLIFLDAGNLVPHIAGGKMNGLLVTSEQRFAALKDVPTAKEAGFAAFDVSTWFGMFARADVAPDVQDKLNAAVRKVMASPKLEEFLKQRGAIPSTMTLSQFKSFFNQEVDTWAEVIRKADIKAE
jgi:tripartite-type tricarboxylate transporter receptor subunit TctC